MPARSDTSPGAGRSQWLESHAFRLLLAAQLALFIAHTLGLRDALRGALLAPIGVCVIASALLALRRHRWVFWTACVLATLTILEILILGRSAHVGHLAGSAFHAPFFCFLAGALTSSVVRSARADQETVSGSICAYLFIALAFASVYAALNAWSPGSFHFTSTPDERLFDELLYFSLVTLTTVGYGDVVPVAESARGLACLEASCGILFPSIVIARIVSLYTSGGGRPFTSPESPGRRRLGRFELLLAVEVVALAGAPLLEGAAARFAVRLSATAMLLAALYAGSGRLTIRVLGLVLAGITLVFEWSPRTLVIREVAFGAEALLLFLVCGSLLLWLAGERRVTADLLLASIALFLLLGFAGAAAFGVAEFLAPGAIGGPSHAVVTRADLVYFSFITLTTTGFGDFVPLTPPVKRLATGISLIGILYPVVLVARLVTLYRPGRALTPSG